ncbi:MAG: DUF4363 family protein [Oscillospiraceae bacterium]|nr:DUF4363 family protein [Oscillospiraceae bacterium]MDE7170767.1 DUF4363 family protein [Oscillospiraceae bacterium]
MKRLYLSIGLIALLAVLSGLHTWQLNRVTGQLTNLLTQAQELVEQEDWEGAARLTRQAKERWMECEGYLHITLRHADTDAIQVSMDEALAFLEGGEKQPAEYAAVNARLLTHLKLLVEAELPTLANLL